MVKRFLALFVGASMSLSLASAQDAKPAPKEEVKPTPKEEAKPTPKEEAQPAPKEAVKPAPKIDPVALARFVAQLGSDRYDDRETACKELDALGAAALEPLRAALGSRDEETRRRAIHVFERIQLRVETARLTKPKMVRLVYTDVPVPQAVQDMARKTGFQIQIEGDQTKLASRKITIDTGEVPFWQAVDQFCLKAGLVERGAAAMPENDPELNNMRMERMRMRMWMIQQQEYGGVKPELPVVFLDGKPQSMPTYYAGALRMRLLPKAAGGAPGATTGAPLNKPEGESLLTVEVTPEPKMGWQNVLSLRVERMIDEKGNELKAPLPYLRDPYEFDDNEWEMRAWRGYNPGGQQQSNLAKQVPLRLQNVKDVKKLKEIHGYVAAEVLTPMQPLMSMEDILNAAGKTVEGESGGSIKVMEVKREEKGQVVIHVVVEKPTINSSGMDFNAMAMGRVRVWRGGFTPQPENEVDSLGRTLSLVDEKGQAFKLSAVQSKVVDPEVGATMEYTLTFQPPAGAPKPVKLTYIGQRLTTIDVPFVLKDVPLP
jgi:hypothetical protein